MMQDAPTMETETMVWEVPCDVLDILRYRARERNTDIEYEGVACLIAGINAQAVMHGLDALAGVAQELGVAYTLHKGYDPEQQIEIKTYREWKAAVDDK